MVFGLDFSEFKKLREALRMSQSTLADLANISQGKVSRIEAGRGNPEAATLNALCAGLDAELILVPRRIGGDVRALVDKHLNRPTSAEGPPMSVRDELFIPDGED